jgi:hypothetical protein
VITPITAIRPEASGRRRTDGANEKDQLRPRILFSDVIEDVTESPRCSLPWPAGTTGSSHGGA